MIVNVRVISFKILAVRQHMFTRERNIHKHTHIQTKVRMRWVPTKKSAKKICNENPQKNI